MLRIEFRQVTGSEYDFGRIDRSILAFRGGDLDREFLRLSIIRKEFSKLTIDAQREISKLGCKKSF